MHAVLQASCPCLSAADWCGACGALQSDGVTAKRLGGHAFCTDCTSQYVTIKVQDDGDAAIACMGFKCPTLLETADVRKALGANPGTMTSTSYCSGSCCSLTPNAATLVCTSACSAVLYISC